MAHVDGRLLLPPVVSGATIYSSSRKGRAELLQARQQVRGGLLRLLRLSLLKGSMADGLLLHDPK